VYLQVVVDVVNGVREAFLDEGMDEQVLLELKQVLTVLTITISVLTFFLFIKVQIGMK